MSRSHFTTDDPSDSAEMDEETRSQPHGNRTYRRRNCVIIEPKASSNEFLQAPRETLATAIRDIMSQLNQGQLLELWHYTSGRGSVDTLLTGYGDIDTTSASRTQTGLDKFGKSTPTHPTANAEELLDVIATTANAHVGDIADVIACDLDLAPLGRQPVTTSRLVIPENNQPTYPGNLHHQPVVEMLYALKQRAVPFVYQVLLEKQNDSSYYLSARLATYDLSASRTQQSDLHRMATDPYPYDLARFFDAVNCTSNLQLPLEDYFSHISRHDGHATVRSHVSESEAERAKDLVFGTREYDKLLEGIMGYDSLYPSTLGYPKIPIDPTHLSNFLTLTATGYEESPWEDVDYRGAPRLSNVTSPLSDPISERPAPEMSAADDSTFGTVANDGSVEHDTLLRDGIRKLGEMGYDLERVEQTTDSIPDAVGTSPDGDTVWVEAEKSNVDKAANYLINVARGRRQDVEVILVVESHPDAQRVADNLRYPVNDQTSDGTLLFNQTDNVHLQDGVVAVLPDGADRSYWYVTPDRELVLRADDSVVARGPLGESVETFEYDCPRYSMERGSHVVTTPSGEQLDRYDTKGDLTDAWTLARRPHVPIAHSYTDGVSIWYQHLDKLEAFTADPEWSLDGKTDRYAAAAETFTERYIADAPGEQLHTDDALAGFIDWYESQTDKKSPGKKYFMETMPEHLDTKRTGDGGSGGKAFKNVTWAVPPSCAAPDLPVFDEETLTDLGSE